MLNALLALVLVGFVVIFILFVFLNKRWRVRNASYVEKLKQTLDVCRCITASVPSDAEDMVDVMDAMVQVLRQKVLPLVGATHTEIHLLEEGEEVPEKKEGVLLLNSSQGAPLGMWSMEIPEQLSKEDRMLLEVIAPYLSWTLENG